MTIITKIDIPKLRLAIQSFDFQTVFEELGWNLSRKQVLVTVKDWVGNCDIVAELGNVRVFWVKGEGVLNAQQRLKVSDEIRASYSAEHILIFSDKKTQAVFFWVKREGKESHPRSHFYFAGQSGDALISKLASLAVDYKELDDSGDMPFLEMLQRLKNALDIEPVTKKFYAAFAGFLEQFVEEIGGIANERERRWYASVLVNRIMFIWFLQKKGALNKGDRDYLPNKLKEMQKQQVDIFYQQFLRALFFEGFAKPEHERNCSQLLGNIPYLNGGLFLPHKLEAQYQNQIHIPDSAFVRLFALFQSYSWSLDDSPTGQDNEINPNVLGYIFEKYINQKAFGAYYTRREITEYLCERTIHRLILDKVHAPAIAGVCEARSFDSMAALLAGLDEDLAHELLHKILPSLSLLDPACGSGAFLVAAMNTLIEIYLAVNARLSSSVSAYALKRRIITHNLFGVDIMEEATEIAKLRLFLALVASVKAGEELEPLPNIDFNIMAGNSLVGLLTVDAERFEKANSVGMQQMGLFQSKKAERYHNLLAEKNRLIECYRDATSYSKDLRGLREDIEEARQQAQRVLNQLLLEEFHQLKIQYEQATWDEAKNKEGKPKKRPLTLDDIERLHPFHWGYEFDQVLAQGGFSAIIANPPWDVFKPDSKEFFLEYSELVSKNKMTIKDFEKEQAKLLTNPDIKSAWLDYLSQFTHVSQFLRTTPQFKHQSAIVNGKKTGSDVNLYKLFTEQSYNLLQDKGLCGIVIPSGIYTDLGTTGLRDLLFNQTEIDYLFGLSNERFIFEGIAHGFKFCLLTFEKGRTTSNFYSAFRINPREAIRVDNLLDFLHNKQEHLKLSVDFLKKLSPDSRSVMEFKNNLDLHIAEKMLQFPLLGEQLENTWNLKLSNEFHMTNDSHLFKTEAGAGRLPLYEGKMIHQFTHLWGEPRYWVDEQEARKALLGKEADTGQKLDYQGFRVGFRDVASSTNERTMIATVLPKYIFCPHTMSLENVCTSSLDEKTRLFIVAIFNSFISDYLIRQRITAHVSFFFVYNLPIPRLPATDPIFNEIVRRAAQLICTTPDYDDLRAELNATGFKDLQGQTDPKQRAQLRAELDAIIAHLYDLTNEELEHILNTFPLVEKQIKEQVINEFETIKTR